MKKERMNMYIITDGVNYVVRLAKGDTITTNKDFATKWEMEHSADNMLRTIKSTKSRTYGHNPQKFKVIEMEENSEGDDMNTKIEPRECVELGFDVQEEVRTMKDKFKLLEDRCEYLKYMISETDRKISDCLHCAEFYNLNASQGYKLYKVIHETQLKRRDIKNELQSIQYILGTKIASDSISNVDKSIYGLYNNQKYTPRVVDELFDLVK
jgi:hypothetical protein